MRINCNGSMNQDRTKHLAKVVSLSLSLNMRRKAVFKVFDYQCLSERTLN